MPLFKLSTLSPLFQLERNEPQSIRQQQDNKTITVIKRKKDKPINMQTFHPHSAIH